MITSEDQIILFQRFIQGNPLLTFCTVYRVSCFLKDNFAVYCYNYLSVTLLLSTTCFWPANTRNNLIARRCIHILGLLLASFSEMIEGNWQISVFLFFVGDFIWMVDVGVNFLHLRLKLWLQFSPFALILKRFAIVFRNLIEHKWIDFGVLCSNMPHFVVIISSLTESCRSFSNMFLFWRHQVFSIISLMRILICFSMLPVLFSLKIFF